MSITTDHCVLPRHPEAAAHGMISFGDLVREGGPPNAVRFQFGLSWTEVVSKLLACWDAPFLLSFGVKVQLALGLGHLLTLI